MSRRPSIPAQSLDRDEDAVVGSPTVGTFSRGTPAIPQTPLVSQFDREQLDAPLPPPPVEGRHEKGASLSATGTKLPQKPLPRRTSNAANHGHQPTVDWSRSDRSGSTFLPLGLFSSFAGRGNGDARGKYEAVGPMRAAKAGDDKYVELDMDDYAEGLKLTVGDDDDVSKSRRSSGGVGAFFDQFYPPAVRRNRRTYERIAFAALAVTFLVVLLSRGGSNNGRPGFVEKAKIRGLGPKNPLRSNIPLHSFRANLKEGTGYVTSFPYGGLTNQLLELFKLVHVAQRLDRAAILPELKATHSEGGDVPLSDFFDLKSFAYYANVSMVQWRDVKIPDITGTQAESLSCWGWRDERPLERYNIKTSFWPFPGQLQVPSSIETSITFPGIEVLASQDNTPWLRETADRFYGGVDNAPAFPDQQLMCFENLFYVPTVKFVEGQLDTSYTIEELRPDGPVWNRVGAHLRFNDHVNHIVDEFLSALLGSRRRAYIGVHLRQGDFVTMGRASKASQEVADMYAAGVKQVQDALKKRRGGPKADLPVVFATDSDDPAFINKLARMGWIYLDHIEFATSSRYGRWYPGIMDSAVLSRAAGFVGTRMSTFSYLAARRVELWQGGYSTIVG
ncbi:O-fucosyltransferase family protein [Rhodotorula paludigena]|uniref:O-fucosyltransferase family protein n=1 Tax=Rhodotorula paludigena TaxID=86838 RepID=UPI00317A9B89